ncbi:MAG: esterase-like activity of phytase family protein [Anaerolineales bacterium]|nr:esterase-like activity of phytase family protein [Anaerolineales bacterium]
MIRHTLSKTLLRSVHFLVTVALLLGNAQIVLAQQQAPPADAPAATLVEYAVLPPDTFSEGPPSGQFNSDGSKAALPRFPAQPVQSFSAIQFSPACDSYYVLSDNGFGNKYNSIDYLLRLYAITPQPRTAEGGRGKILVDDFIQLRDPAGLTPFFIIHEFTEERWLTGADFDVESFVFDADGTLWIGDEFGPYLLRFDAEGRLLEAPIPTPNFDGEAPFVQSPQHPAILARSPQPGAASAANLRASRGFEGMATNPARTTLYPMLEGTVTGDPEGALRIYTFDVASQQYVTDTVRFYPLADPNHSIGEFTVINDDEFLVIERDNDSGDEATFKKIFKINLNELDEQGFVQKEEVVDLLTISDPDDLAGFGATFRFPFATIEDVLVLDAETIVVMNDNNYDGRGGRGATIKDANELLVLRLATPLQLADGVGRPEECR